VAEGEGFNDELEKPQLDTAHLPQLAANLNDLQKQVGVLKGFVMVDVEVLVTSPTCVEPGSPRSRTTLVS
jgi:hypothetical protein